MLLVVMLAPVVAGVALGYLLGGRLAGFGAIRIRALWLVWLAAGVQFAQYSALGARPLLAVVFTLVAAWLAVNIPEWPGAVRAAAVVIVLGASLNGLAIALNGRMPYDAARRRVARADRDAEERTGGRGHPARRSRRHHRDPAAARGRQPR
nr:hypothetical protein GCM10020092_072470 [Actinoplanes digitatis]